MFLSVEVSPLVKGTLRFATFSSKFYPHPVYFKILRGALKVIQLRGS